MNEFILTVKGQQLVSRMIAGTSTATFTRVETSDHVYERGEIAALTALEDVKQEVLISKVTRTDPALVELLVVLQNQSVTTAYNVCALGVYARDSEQNEILFGVAVDTDTPDPVPTYGGKTVSEITYHLIIKVAVSDKVEITVNPSASATVEQLEAVERTFVTHAEAGIFGETGVHGYRYYDEKLQYKDGDIWKDILPGIATQSTSGFMSAADKKKLDGVEAGANKTTVEDNLTSESTTAALSAAQGKTLNDKIGAKVVITNDDTTPPDDHSVLWVHG